MITKHNYSLQIDELNKQVPKVKAGFIQHTLPYIQSYQSHTSPGRMLCGLKRWVLTLTENVIVSKYFDPKLTKYYVCINTIHVSRFEYYANTIINGWR